MNKKSGSKHTTNDAAALLANPYYAITFDGGLFGEHAPMVSEEQWVAANTRLIDELGAEAYLRQLLTVLKGDYPRQPHDAGDRTE